MVEKNYNFTIVPIEDKERKAVRDFIKKHWSSEKIVYNGKVFYPHKLFGFIVKDEQKIIGLITYKRYRSYFLIITINSLITKKGIGTRLIELVKKEAKRYGAKKIKVRTTNDNLYVLRFYQKREFRLAKIYKEAVIKSRKIKPNIPLIGENGIPLRDEIELEFREL